MLVLRLFIMFNICMSKIVKNVSKLYQLRIKTKQKIMHG